MGMSVLLLGGTGAIGSYLAPMLSDAGHSTCVTTRYARKPSAGVTFLLGNAHDPGFLHHVLARRWDVIVDFMVYKTSEFAEAAPRLLAATDHYVFLSSARVYDCSLTPLTESSPRLLDTSKDEEFLGTDDYSLAKARQEDVLRRSGRHNWTIVRPYITYSQDRLQLGILEKEEWLYRALQGKPIVIPYGLLPIQTTMTHGQDVALAINALVGVEQAMGDTFHIAQPNACTWHDVLHLYIDALKALASVTPAVLLCDWDTFLRIYPRRYQVIYDRMFVRRFNSDKISTHMAENGFRDLRTALPDALGRFLEKQSFNAIDWRSEARADRLCRYWHPVQTVPGLRDKAKYLRYRLA
jgi:nucleoside-diphosphate-sugar epimerase